MAFMARVKKGESKAENADLFNIGRCAMGSPAIYATDTKGELIFKDGKPIVIAEEKPPTWTASAWRLERKFPERYGRRVEAMVKGVGPKGEIVVTERVVDWKKISDEDLRTLRRIAEKAIPKPEIIH